MQVDFVWGFLSPSVVKDLGHIGVPEVKYAFLLNDLKNFNSQMSEYLEKGTERIGGRSRREIAVIQLSDRMIILCLISIFTADFRYYKQANELLKNPAYFEILPNDKKWQMVSEPLRSKFNKEWLKELQNALSLFTECSSFDREVRQLLNQQEYEKLVKANLFEHEFIYEVANLYRTIEKVKDVIKKWEGALFVDYGFLGEEHIKKLDGGRGKGKPDYRPLTDLTVFDDHLANMDSNSKSFIIYQVQRRILGLVSATLLENKGEYLKIAQKLFSMIDEKALQQMFNDSNTTIQTHEEIQECSALLIKANEIFNNKDRFIANWVKLEILQMGRINSDSSLKDELEARGIDYNVLNDHRLGSVVNRYLMVEKISNVMRLLSISVEKEKKKTKKKEQEPEKEKEQEQESDSIRRTSVILQTMTTVVSSFRLPKSFPKNPSQRRRLNTAFISPKQEQTPKPSLESKGSDLESESPQNDSSSSSEKIPHRVLFEDEYPDETWVTGEKGHRFYYNKSTKNNGDLEKEKETQMYNEVSPMYNEVSPTYLKLLHDDDNDKDILLQEPLYPDETWETDEEEVEYSLPAFIGDNVDRFYQVAKGSKYFKKKTI